MANRYWVGGTGVWDTVSTANWSSTSGGAAGASAPSSADIVFINASSGSGTITLGADVDIVRLDARNSTFDVDWNNYKIAINGSGTTVWYSGGLTAIGTAEAKVEFTYNGSNLRTLVLSGSVGENSAISIYVTNGIGDFRIGSGSTGIIQNLNFTGFSGSLTTLTTAASWTVYGDLTLSPTMTMPTMAGAFLLRGVAAQRTVTTNGKAFNQPITIDAPANTIKFADSLTCTTLTLTAGTIQLAAAETSTVTNFATPSTAQKFLQSTIAGTQATLFKDSGIVNATNLTIQDINASGGAAWNLVNGSVSQGNLSGWYVAHQQNAYYPGGIF
jgi:hypothetical protein